jgi:hypothetical protein
MTQFLLAGSRPPRPGNLSEPSELALAAAAHRVVAAATWHGWLRRWGLLLSFGLARDPVAELRACLVVLASDNQAAERLAAGWGTVSGYRVAVLPLTGETAGETGP